MSRNTVPLWPVPVAIAATLAIAAHLALWLSIRDGHVAACIPYVDGCASISRAARHGLANHLFRLLVLPCAVLVGLHWWLSSLWLRAHGTGSRPLAAMGLVAAASLAVYATFLGTDGDVYRILRRHGVIVFFGASYLAQLAFVRAAGSVAATGRRSLRAICVAMLLLGLVHVAALALAAGSAFQDRLENALEWQLGLLLAAWYLAQARLWRRSGFALQARVGSD